ncbi:MAG: nucleic acid/nucleotide deaminase domain-containing protein [Moheibacter sp.]
MSELSDIMGYESPFGEDSLFASPPEPDKWLYRIIKSTDGSELINQYLKYDYAIEEAKGITDEDIDFLIYIEIPNSNGITIELSRVVLIKMSKVFKEYLTENPKFIPYYAKEIAEREYSYAITEEELTKAFSLELRYRNAKYLEFADEMYTENELAETFLDAFSDGFRGLKIPEEYWNPDLKSKNYLGPEKFINTAVQKLQKLYRNLKAIKDFLSKNKDIPLARNLIQFIDSVMKDIASMVQWLLKLKKLTQVQFAFLCGMVNGCMEFLAGIVDMAVLAIKIRNQMANGIITGELELDMMAVTESVEFLIEQYIKDPEFLKKQMAQAMAGYVETRYNSSLSRYVIAHNAGEDTIIAIDIVISEITIVKGLTQAAQKLPKFTRWIDDVLARNGKGARKLENALLKLKKVAYGESELSKSAIKYRKTLPKPKHNGNIAIFEYIDDTGKTVRKEFTTVLDSDDHAEMIGMKWLRENGIIDEKVVKIYSELEPCGLEKHNCKQRLQRYKNAEIEYSYDYPGDKNIGVEIRRNSIKERKKDLVKFVK